VADGRPPGTEQVPDGLGTAVLVVGDQGEISRVARVRHRVDHGDPQVPADRLALVLAAPGDDDAAHPAFQQGLEIVLLAEAIVAALAQEDQDAAWAESLLGPLHHRDAEAAKAVGGDQPDGEAPAGQQAAARAFGW
jgi:hypothetical protein